MKDHYSTYLCKPTLLDKMREYISMPLRSATHSVEFNDLVDKAEADGLARIKIRASNGIIIDVVSEKIMATCI